MKLSLSLSLAADNASVTQKLLFSFRDHINLCFFISQGLMDELTHTVHQPIRKNGEKKKTAVSSCVPAPAPRRD